MMSSGENPDCRADGPTRLVLFSKYPTPGTVKTRLIPELGPNGAAALHRRLAKHCFDRISRSAVRDEAICEVRYSGADEQAFRAWLGEEGQYVPQSEGDLGARLLDAASPLPCIFFGADTPDLSEDIVDQALSALDEHDVVIGPAEDGGYYLIGTRRHLPFLFVDMPWSTPDLLNQTLEVLRKHDIAPKMLPMLRDCDRPEDLAHWPWLTA